MIFRNKNKNILKDCSNMNIVQYIDERLKQLNFTFIEKKIGKNGKVYFEGECTYKKK